MLGNANPFPLSDRFIESFQPKGREHDFLKARASASRSFETHDFNRSVTADVTNNWTVGATSTATTWAMLAEPGGWLRGVTGASVATGALQLYAPNKMWNGTSGAGFASLIRLSAVTNIRVEQGFADVIPAVGTTALNLASNSFNSITAGAVYLYDEGVGASAAMSGLYTIGTSVAYGAVATTTNRYASGVTLFVAMEIIGTTVSVWIGNNNGAPLVKATSAIAAADTFVPFIAVKTASGSKNVDIDTLWTWTNGRV
jgi:hypothetical protein